METLEVEEYLLLPDSDGISRRHFIPPQYFKQKKGYVRTKFHETFMEDLAQLRCSWERDCSVSGISGVGKTFTLIYFMLDCLKKNDDSVHYIDLQKPGFKIEKFFEYAKGIKGSPPSFLILDHVTIFNAHHVEEIRKRLSVTILQVEAGFTASASRKNLLYRKDYQLDKGGFNDVWCAILQAQHKSKDLKKEGREIYEACERRQYLITPWLIRKFLFFMCINRLNRIQALHAYQSFLENQIKGFAKTEVTDTAFKNFLLHTQILLNYLPAQSDYIFNKRQYDELKISSNIFHMEPLEVTEEDLNKDPRFLQAGLKEDDPYYRVSQLVPSLAKFWKKELPFDFLHVLDCKDEATSLDHVTDIMISCGGSRKEMENLVVTLQREGFFTITPDTPVMTTSFQKSSNNSYIPQLRQKHTTLYGAVYTPCKEEFQSLDTSSFSGRCLNVAKCALWMKQKVNNNPSEEFILHPDVLDLMGVDYFCKTRGEIKAECGSKLPRTEDNLFMVQVASGAIDHGESVGKALDVVKEILAEESLIIHVIIIIVVESFSRSFCLKKCKIENASVINLCEVVFMERIKCSHRLLYRFLKKIISRTPHLQSDADDDNMVN